MKPNTKGQLPFAPVLFTPAQFEAAGFGKPINDTWQFILAYAADAENDRIFQVGISSVGRFELSFTKDSCMVETCLQEMEYNLMRQFVEGHYMWVLKSRDDVAEAIRYMIVDNELGAGFHPDTPMVDYMAYVDDKKIVHNKCFTLAKAQYMQSLLSKCQRFCKLNALDIYQISLHEFLKTKAQFNNDGIKIYGFDELQAKNFDGIVIHPVAVVSWDGKKAACEQVEPQHSHFWGVYARQANGCLHCLADCETEALANSLKDLIEKS